MLIRRPVCAGADLAEEDVPRRLRGIAATAGSELMQPSQPVTVSEEAGGNESDLLVTEGDRARTAQRTLRRPHPQAVWDCNGPNSPANDWNSRAGRYLFLSASLLYVAGETGHKMS